MWVRIWEEKRACWALPSSPGRLTSSLPAAAAFGPHKHMEGSLNLGCSTRPKWMGAHTTRMFWTPWQFARRQFSHPACWIFSLGPAWDGGEHILGDESQHQGTDWAAKSEWGPTDRSVLSSMAVHWDRWLHYIVLSQLRAHVGPPACQDHPGVGVVELNILQELKIMSTWTATSGPTWEAGHVLAALSAL